MPDILVASDSRALLDEVTAAIEGRDTAIRTVTRGQAVRPEVQTDPPDLVVLDLQIGNMGAMAVSLDLRHEADAGRLGPTKVLLLLDRVADVYLARRSRADGWLIKPLDAFRLKAAVRRLLTGEHWYEGAPDLVGNEPIGDRAPLDLDAVGETIPGDELEPEPT